MIRFFACSILPSGGTLPAVASTFFFSALAMPVFAWGVFASALCFPVSALGIPASACFKATFGRGQALS